LERTETRFGIEPASLTADSAHGSAESLAGSSNRRRSLHTSGSSTNQREPRAHSPGPISYSTPSVTVTPAGGQGTGSIPAYLRDPPGAASRPRRHGSIASANWIATSANSKRSAARTLSPAGSRGICTKMPATWPVRSLRLRHTWRPVAVGRKSRCCSPISSVSYVLHACSSGVRTEPKTNFSSRPAQN
jgi:hypothetical protein